MRRVAVRVVGSVAIYLAIAALLVAFGTSKAPPISSVVAGPFAALRSEPSPPIRRYLARDGTSLTYREYPGSTNQFVVLIHGSAGSSIDMHPLAALFHEQGYTVYVPDLRGHGENRSHGDVAYVGQLDDDMEDFLQSVSKGHPAGHGTLVGFSSGGGFAVRLESEGRIAKYFQRVVLLAPYLRYDAPSVRQESRALIPSSVSASTPWAVPYTARIIGLSMLNRLGVHFLDELPVLVFAVRDSSDVTRTYSWRLQQNFGAHSNYAADILALPNSTAVLVGSKDSVLLPAELQEEFHSRRAEIAVYCVPGVGHSGLVTDPEGLHAILGVLTGRPALKPFVGCE